MGRAGDRARRQPGQAEATTHTFGDFTLDLSSRRLSRQGEEVVLTPKEFGLLALFCRRPGRALTRDEILSRVWGSEVFVTSRSVDRCVNTLRTKIEPDPARPRFIQTVRPVGYRFEP